MKNPYLAFFIFLFFFIIYSCSDKKSGLDLALEAAGENRPELEKVLQYYSRNPEDSLKYRAARFLIENMPYYYSCTGASLDTFKNAFIRITREGTVGKQALDLVEKRYGPLNYQMLEKVPDIKTVDSGFLIDNIEHSFMVWERQPWGKYIPFDTFCNFILPYRIKDEPLENWKPVYCQRYQPVLDSLLQTNKIMDASLLLYNHIIKESWYFVMEMPPPHVGAGYLLEQRSGSCRDRCDLAIYVMRSLGIPVGVDQVLHNPDQAGRHFWSFVLDEQGNSTEFTLWEEAPVKDLQIEIEKKRGKVYRETFGVEEKCLRLRKLEKSIPPSLGSLFLEDASSGYFQSNTISFSKEEMGLKNREVCYLSVFDIEGWCPIAWGEVRDDRVIFQDIEPGVMYALTGSGGDYSDPVYFPFILNKDNTKRYFIPDTNQVQTLNLERKFTMKFMKPHMKRFRGGFFEASNSSDFSNSKVVYTIDRISMPKYYECEITVPGSYRYIRYFSPDSSLCNMAELEFYDANNRQLTGEIIGTEGAWNNEERLMKQAVFDRDPLTFFNASESQGVWVGLDFGKAQEIKKIRYLPRNDDNFIRGGEQYELFYLGKNGWTSLSQKTGVESRALVYENAPVNALFWLRNYTKGKEERIFTYENGEQIWW